MNLTHLTKKAESELRKAVLQKLDIIRMATAAASHKVSKEKMETAAKWLHEIHEQVKLLTKLCEDEL